MSESISDIRLVEARSILLIKEKLEYGNLHDVDRVIGYLEDSDRFTSDSAKRLLDELREYSFTEIPGIKCPLCGEMIEDDGRLICEECTDYLQKLVKDADEECIRQHKVHEAKLAEKEAEVQSPVSLKLEELKHNIKNRCSAFLQNIKKKNAAVAAELAPILKKPVFWVMAFLSTIVIAGFIAGGILLARANDVTGNLYRRFGTNISDAGYFMGNISTPQKGVIKYDIMPTYESLMVFVDDDGEFVGAALDMQGSDEVSRKRQAIFIKALNMALYKDITERDATSLVSLISYNQGLLNFRGYQCILAFTDDAAYYYMINEQKVDSGSLQALAEYGVNGEVISGNEDDSAKELTERDVLFDIDGTELVGKQVSSCDEVFGESVSVVTDNALYYETVGVSVVYDKDTKEVLYIDCDGTGTLGSVKIAGIYIGEPATRVYEYFLEKGIETDIDDNTEKYEIDIKDGNGSYRVEISLSNARVNLVSATKIKE